jgi:predicted dehydrogenase
MLKVGVFGVGHLGKFHLNNWKEIDGAELTGFYDPSESNAAEIKQQYGLTQFKSAEELIES